MTYKSATNTAYSMRWFSFEGKFVLTIFATMLFSSVITAALGHYLDSYLAAIVFTLITLSAPVFLLTRQLTKPMSTLVQALLGSVAAFRDGDFNFSIHCKRNDELGDLVSAHNKLGDALRKERQNLFQRELLLDTVVQNTPIALILVDADGHIVYANLAAHDLLNNGQPIMGKLFTHLLETCPPALAQTVMRNEDGLFTVQIEKEEETFHLSQRQFNLQGRQHRLYLIKWLTRELSRQEVATWKKVIRVISHELNNSLAPIRSLAHSGREILHNTDTTRLKIVFDTIEERAQHLEHFTLGYARFAKLPLPRAEIIVWTPFLTRLKQHYSFHLTKSPSTPHAYFDREQIEQALINILKNAHESGSAIEAIEMAIEQRHSELRIEVKDDGTGMSEQILTHALLPFYSTKRTGTGLGLALTREIAEAHGGRIQLANCCEGGLSVTIILPQYEATPNSK